MSIGYNINGQQPRDLAQLMSHHQTVEPRWTLVMDNDGLGANIRNLNTKRMNVMLRHFPDGGETITPGNPKYSAPQDWFRKHNKAQADLYLYTTNEPLPGRSAPEFMERVKQLNDWHMEVMDLAETAGRRLVILNVGVGKLNPPDKDGNGNDWALFDTVLRRAVAKPELFVIGAHEYAGGVITSGFIGGDPTMIQPEFWPQDLSGITQWHCGRYNFLLQYCDKIKIPYPRIVITEHGFDRLDDIGGWLQALQKTPPYQDIRGWKTLVFQWETWWSGWSAQQAYVEQMRYADRVIYPNDKVEAQLLFTWSANPDWQIFDLSQATQFQTLLTEPVVEPPEPEPEPPLANNDAIIQLLEDEITHLNSQLAALALYTMKRKKMLEELINPGEDKSATD